MSGGVWVGQPWVTAVRSIAVMVNEGVPELPSARSAGAGRIRSKAA